MNTELASSRDRPVSRKADYLLALFAFFFPFAFCGCGGALKMRRSASSKGIGVRSGLGSFLVMVGESRP